jgi:hypothetical protein
MRTKIIFGLVLGLLLISNFAFAGLPWDFKPGKEPDGFSGIKWGTDISTLPDMEYVSTDPSDEVDIFQIYKKKNDELKMGGAALEKINYGFWRRKKVLIFDYVNIYIKGYVNWVGLRDVLFEKFGQGYQESKHPEEYTWLGETTNMRLRYNEHTKKGNLWMTSTKIHDQQEEYYNKQKEKGWAAEDAYSYIPVKEPPIPVKGATP